MRQYKYVVNIIVVGAVIHPPKDLPRSPDPRGIQ